MKVGKVTKFTVSMGLMVVMINGCGGGGSDTPTSTATLTELTPEVAEKMVVSASEALPVCSYTSNTVVTTTSKYVDLINKTSLKEVIKINKETTSLVIAESINDTISGTCPTNPGSYTVSGIHEDGVDDLLYTFNNYCIGDDVENVTLSGTADVKNVGTPSPTGPIPEYTSISTGSDGITTIEKSAEGTYSHNVKVDDLKYTHGNGNDDTTAESPSILTIGSLSALDGKTNGTFSVSNVDISTYDSGTDDVTTINNITYTDPENGSVNVSSTAITTNADDVIVEGEMIITGSNDTKVTMPLSSSVQNAFDLMMDGEVLGVLDCSGSITISL